MWSYATGIMPVSHRDAKWGRPAKAAGIVGGKREKRVQRRASELHGHAMCELEWKNAAMMR